MQIRAIAGRSALLGAVSVALMGMHCPPKHGSVAPKPSKIVFTGVGPAVGGDQDGETGGTGGTAFTEGGNESEALVGLVIWHGAVVDAVQPIFGTVHPDGSISGRRKGQKYGGIGGEPAEVSTPGYVVVGLNVKSGVVVDQIQVVMQRWSDKGLVANDVVTAPWVGGSGGDLTRSLTAGPGRIATHLLGKRGDRLDRIGFQGAQPTPM